MEPALLSSRAFSGGLLVALVFFAGMTAMVFALGLYLQLGLGLSPLRAGLTQAPWALGIAVGAGLSGAVLGRRFGRRVLQAVAVVAAAGIGGLMLTVGWTGAAMTAWEPAPALLVCGLGIGLLLAPLFDIVLAGVALPMVGSASGVLNANQQLGAAAGVGVLGTVFFASVDVGDPLAGVQLVLGATAGLVLLAGVLSYLLPRFARETDGVRATDGPTPRPAEPATP